MKKFILCSVLLIFILKLESQTQVGKYVFNSTVSAIVIDSSGSSYVGGSFTTVGLYHGSGVKFNSAGVYDSLFSKVGGTIHSLVSIPGGGWYIGGNFTSIDSVGINVTRNRLARINTDGSLHSFNPNMSSAVTTLALDASGNLYVGGAFTTVGGSATRNRLAKFDHTGTLTSFNPNLNNFVNALILDASGNLYIADSANHLIEKIDTSGKIIVIAGNSTSSTFPLIKVILS